MSKTDKDKRIAELEEALVRLEVLLKKAYERIEELERRLNLNSSNSSKSQLSDGLPKKPSPTSLRPKTDKSSGDKQGTLVIH